MINPNTQSAYLKRRELYLKDKAEELALKEKQQAKKDVLELQAMKEHHKEFMDRHTGYIDLTPMKIDGTVAFPKYCPKKKHGFLNYPDITCKLAQEEKPEGKDIIYEDSSGNPVILPDSICFETCELLYTQDEDCESWLIVTTKN